MAGGELEVVEDGEHGPPRLDEGAHPLHEPELVMDVEVGRRLVEEEELGLLRERLGQQNPLPLAAAEREDGAPGEAGEVDADQRRAGALAVLGGVGLQPAPVRRPPQEHEVLDAEVEGERERLADEGEAAGQRARLPRPDLPPPEHQTSVVGERPADGPQERGLAAAVGAEHAEPRPLGHVQPDAVQHRLPPERDAQPFRNEDRQTRRGAWVLGGARRAGPPAARWALERQF